MTEILKTAYPEATIGVTQRQAQRCEPNVNAARWISRQARQWRIHLESEAGFEAPGELKVCRAALEGSPRPVYASLNSQEIYVPPVVSQNDELSVLHEYLHIAFRNHPKGRNEAFIENLANRLQENP